MSALRLGMLPALAAGGPAAGTVSTGETVIFWVIAPLMVLGALSLLFSRKAVHTAVAVVGVMVALAVVYLVQGAHFLGFAQIIVYTGAVMMLFLFVLMLVGVDSSDSVVETLRGQRWIGALCGAGLLAVLVAAVASFTLGDVVGLEAANADSNPVGVARVIFSDYVFALEIVGALLVTAALGALVLTHRERLVPRVTQKERADARVARGVGLGPLPSPGFYARHSALDVPALDPEGNPVEESVSRVLRIRGQQQGVDPFRAQIEAEEEDR